MTLAVAAYPLTYVPSSVCISKNQEWGGGTIVFDVDSKTPKFKDEFYCDSNAKV